MKCLRQAQGWTFCNSFLKTPLRDEIVLLKELWIVLLEDKGGSYVDTNCPFPLLLTQHTNQTRVSCSDFREVVN